MASNLMFPASEEFESKEGLVELSNDLMIERLIESNTIFRGCVKGIRKFSLLLLRPFNIAPDIVRGGYLTSFRDGKIILVDFRLLHGCLDELSSLAGLGEHNHSRCDSIEPVGDMHKVPLILGCHKGEQIEVGVLASLH